MAGTGMTSRAVSAASLALLLASGSAWSSAGARGQEPKPAFDVVLVRRLDPSAPRSPRQNIAANGVFEARNTVAALVITTYSMDPARVVGLPDWARTEVYDISARSASTLSSVALRPLVQSLLEDRFGLRFHTEQRPMAHFELRHAQLDGTPGPPLPSTAECGTRSSPPPAGTTFVFGSCSQIPAFAMMLSGALQRPVIDRTGLAGVYELAVFLPADEPRDLGISAPALRRALREHWGLALESTEGPLDVMVIDALQRPTEN
jgi:uncharacterized protein (TIGR03435 family)